MPHVDFPNIPDGEEFEPIPAGDYLCKCTDVEVGESRNDNEMWTLTWTVEEGEYRDRRIFDRLVFTEKAMPRIKLVCNRLGIDTSGPMNLSSWMLEGRLAEVTVFIESYQRDDGEERKRNTVPYRGYEYVDQPPPLDATEARAAGTGEHRPVTDDDIPFAWLLPFLLIGWLL